MNDKVRMKLGKKASNTALIINISLMILKALTGVAARSTAIIADAFNNGTDIFASIAVYGGLRVAYLPPDEKHHYGHAKAESIVSKIVALIVMLTGGTIGWSAVQQILSGRSEIPGIPAIIISGVSIVVKLLLYRYTNSIGKKIDSPAVIADSYNHRSDVLASFSSLIGVAGARLGFPILDPIAGLVVAVIIFKTGISLYLEAIDALMDTAPSREIMDSLLNDVKKTEGVLRVNEIRARKFGPKLHVDLKICVDKDITVEKGHEVASNVKHNLMNDIKNVQDVMIHVNPCTNLDKDKTPRCRECSKNVNSNIEIQ